MLNFFLNPCRSHSANITGICIINQNWKLFQKLVNPQLLFYHYQTVVWVRRATGVPSIRQVDRYELVSENQRPDHPETRVGSCL